MNPRITPPKTYVLIWAGLLFLLLLTLGIAQVNLGSLNIVAALTIAVTKMLLVILFFMHVIHSTRLTWVVVIASFLWLGVLFVLTFADYLTRVWQIY